jgi:integrase
MRGHIRKRGSKWACVIDVGRDPVTGARRQQWHSGYLTKRAAEEALGELLHQLATGSYVSPSRLELGAFLTEQWLPAISSSVTASTFESYSRIVRQRIVPALGATPLQSLTAAQINGLYGHLQRAGRLTHGHVGQPLSRRSVRLTHAILRKALGDAVRWGIVVRNVADAAEPPAARQCKAPTPKTWSATELHQFLDHVADDRLRAMWVLLATTGMRRGEAAGLQWADLDLDAGRAAISRARVSVAYEVQTSTPKSDRGRRNVALDTATVTALRDHRRAQLEERLAYGPGYLDSELVFTREDGAPLHPERISTMFLRHGAAAGLPRIRVHDMRHTWASLALGAGVSPKIVSERLGHASVGFTLDVYSHVIPGLQQDAAQTVADLVL